MQAAKKAGCSPTPDRNTGRAPGWGGGHLPVIPCALGQGRAAAGHPPRQGGACLSSRCLPATSLPAASVSEQDSELCPGPGPSAQSTQGAASFFRNQSWKSWPWGHFLALLWLHQPQHGPLHPLLRPPGSEWAKQGRHPRGRLQRATRVPGSPHLWDAQQTARLTPTQPHRGQGSPAPASPFPVPAAPRPVPRHQGPPPWLALIGQLPNQSQLTFQERKGEEGGSSSEGKKENKIRVVRQGCKCAAQDPAWSCPPHPRSQPSAALPVQVREAAPGPTSEGWGSGIL